MIIGRYHYNNWPIPIIAKQPIISRY